jgi:hypothetical protein
MKRASRLLLLLVPLVFGWLSHARPARAEEGPTARFAFADTTLLRDTLDLKFDRLFPLADSLRILPDTLRALSIRYDLSLERLVALSDSLRAPVDSVGVMLLREQFSPLAVRARSASSFRYSSSYLIGQTSTTWSNSSDYNFSRGAMFAHSVINITMGRYLAGKALSLRQTRSFSTELGWRLSDNMSLGGRANLQGFANLDRSIYSVSDNSDDFQFSLRSRQAPLKGLTSELNFFSGLLEQAKSSAGKRGITGDLNGRVIYTSGRWLSQSLDGQITGNSARTHPPGSTIPLSTNDLSSNLRGSLALFESSPIGFNVGYGLRSSRVESPVARPVPAVLPVLTSSRELSVDVLLRVDSNRSLSLSQHWDDSQNLTSTGYATTGSTSALTTSTGQGFSAEARYPLVGFDLSVHYADNHGDSRSPRLTIADNPASKDTIDYRDQQLQHTRSADATLSRILTRHLTMRASGSVGLDAYDYRVNDPRAPVTNPRDQYSQSYRIEGLYAPSSRFNTAVTLEVARTLFLNLTSASSSSNTESRSYRTEWRWNCNLMPGLTATQRNSISATYDYYTYQLDQNRLSLDYGSATSLNATLTPRLRVDISHSTRYQPRGTYNRSPDGLEYFSPGDEGRNYLLGASISYAPFPALSFSLSPSYQLYDRSTRTSAGTVPQSRQNSLNFSGGANMNLPVGGRGRLSGNIQHTYNSSRNTSYTSGAVLSPLSEIDFWNGSLLFSWSL